MVIKGLKTIQVSSFTSTHPFDGTTEGVVFEGIANDVLGLKAGYDTLGAQTHYTAAEGFGRLEVTLSQPASSYNWECIGNDAQKSILELPNVVALGADSIQLIKDKFNAGSPGERDAISLDSGDETAIYDLLVQGSDFYYYGTPVIRKTITIGTTAAITDALVGVGTVWTAAQIIANETTIFASIKDTINVWEMVHETTLAGYTWGYLKKVPSITQRWGQKVELTQEWWGENWDTSIRYDLYAP